MACSFSMCISVSCRFSALGGKLTGVQSAAMAPIVLKISLVRAEVTKSLQVSVVMSVSTTGTCNAEAIGKSVHI